MQNMVSLLLVAYRIFNLKKVVKPLGYGKKIIRQTLACLISSTLILYQHAPLLSQIHKSTTSQNTLQVPNFHEHSWGMNSLRSAVCGMILSLSDRNIIRGWDLRIPFVFSEEHRWIVDFSKKQDNGSTLLVPCHHIPQKRTFELAIDLNPETTKREMFTIREILGGKKRPVDKPDAALKTPKAPATPAAHQGSSGATLKLDSLERLELAGSDGNLPIIMPRRHVYFNNRYDKKIYWEQKGTMHPSIADVEHEVSSGNYIITLIYRAVGNDGFSRLGLAVMTMTSDGKILELTRFKKPIMDIRHGEFDSHGCEDMRVSIVTGEDGIKYVYGYYTAVSQAPYNFVRRNIDFYLYGFKKWPAFVRKWLKFIEIVLKYCKIYFFDNNHGELFAQAAMARMPLDKFRAKVKGFRNTAGDAEGDIKITFDWERYLVNKHLEYQKDHVRIGKGADGKIYFLKRPLSMNRKNYKAEHYELICVGDSEDGPFESTGVALKALNDKWQDWGGGGTNFVETKLGYLSLDHWAKKARKENNPDCRIYRAGALLLDKDDPRKILFRSKETAIMEPALPWENGGFDAWAQDGRAKKHPDIDLVFPTGLYVLNEDYNDETGTDKLRLLLTYGAADRYGGAAIVNLTLYDQAHYNYASVLSEDIARLKARLYYETDLPHKVSSLCDGLGSIKCHEEVRPLIGTLVGQISSHEPAWAVIDTFDKINAHDKTTGEIKKKIDVLYAELFSDKTLIEIIDKLGDLGAIDYETHKLLYRRIKYINRNRHDGKTNLLDAQHYYLKIKALARYRESITMPKDLEIPLSDLFENANRKGIIETPHIEKGELARLNAGAFQKGNRRYVFSRIYRKNPDQGDPVKTYSVLGLSVYDNKGNNLKEYDTCLDPQEHLADFSDDRGRHPFESDSRKYGAEDARIIHIGAYVYACFTLVTMTERGDKTEPEWWKTWGIYTATARIKLEDLENGEFNWEYLPHASLVKDWPGEEPLEPTDPGKTRTKNGMILNIRMDDGRYLALIRPLFPSNDPSGFTRGPVYWGVSNELHGPYKILQDDKGELQEAWGPRDEDETSSISYERTFVGTTGPLYKTDIGYINITHAGTRSPDGNVYRLGVKIHDLNDPTKIIYNSWLPVLVPEMAYELQGWVGNVVYSCQFIPVVYSAQTPFVRDKLIIYYGTADRYVAVTELTLAKDWRQLTPEKLEATQNREKQLLERKRDIFDALYFDKARSKSATAAVAGISDYKHTETLLRDILNEKEVPKNLVELLIGSMYSGKKLVMAFHNDLGAMQGRKPLGILEALLELKKSGQFKKFLANLEVKKGGNERIREIVSDNENKDDTEVFIFARKQDEKNLDDLTSARRFYINEAPLGFGYAYYPLAEIITIALSQYLSDWPSVSARLNDLDLEQINISSVIETDTGSILFTLIPKITEENWQSLVERYANLRRLLIQA